MITGPRKDAGVCRRRRRRRRRRRLGVDRVIKSRLFRATKLSPLESPPPQTHTRAHRRHNAGIGDSRRRRSTNGLIYIHISVRRGRNDVTGPA